MRCTVDLIHLPHSGNSLSRASRRIWIIYFTDSLQQQANYSWTPYVTSSFQLHGLTAATGIVSGLVSGVIKFPFAKFIDIVGRPQGFAIMLSFAVMCMLRPRETNCDP